STVENGQMATRPAASRGQAKTVRMEPLAAISDPAAIAQRALDAARAGARVLVIRNTVRDAIKTRQALEAIAPADVVQFAVNGRPALHHGRFARGDRKLLNGAVEA